MKKTIYILLIFLNFGFLGNNNCELKNGKYKVIYDTEFSEYSELELIVSDKTLTEIYSDSKKSEYKINWLTENTFRLEPTEKRKDSLTEIEKKLKTLGNPYYELTECSNDTIQFILRRNLHIMVNSGKFIRTDE